MTPRQQLAEAKRKMALACQNGSKKAWRKYGKLVYKLSLELGVPIDNWLRETFEKKV
jgi:hypothetical protein